MPNIKIVTVPPGLAPLECREAWLHLEIPYLPKKSTNTTYAVDPDVAIAKLQENGKYAAVEFWTKLKGSTFGFPKYVCEKNPKLKRIICAVTMIVLTVGFGYFNYTQYITKPDDRFIWYSNPTKIHQAVACWLLIIYIVLMILCAIKMQIKSRKSSTEK